MVQYGKLRLLLMTALILSAPGSAGAANDTQAAEPGADEVVIEIGSTYSFGPTPAGASVSRSFRLVNKDTTRPMRIYGFWIGQNMNHPEWAIIEKPGEDQWLPSSARTSPWFREERCPASTMTEPTRAQIALAWLLAQKPWIVPIPGTAKLHRLRENVAAASVELTESDLREIENAANQITVQGARYPESSQRMIDR